MTDRWLCQSCDWIGDAAELLWAPSPFDPEQQLCGCPKCKAVDDVVEACDEPGCNRASSCGFPTSLGKYRRTCFEHSEFFGKVGA